MCGNLVSSTTHLNSTQSSLFWHILMYWATFMKIDNDWIKSNSSFSKPHDHSRGMPKLISRDNIRILFDQIRSDQTRTQTTKCPLMLISNDIAGKSSQTVRVQCSSDLTYWPDLLTYWPDWPDLTDKDMFTLLISDVLLLRVVLYLYCTAWSSSSCSCWLIVAWNSPAMQDDASANADICEN